MPANERHFFGFQDHTILKHIILKSYLQAWAFKLLQRPGAESPIYFVDGFAGAGGDENGNPGSPTIAAMVAEQVDAVLRRTHGSDRRMAVIAIEADPTYFRLLNIWLGHAAAQVRSLVSLRQGTLDEHLPNVLAEIGTKPTLYFLDPFGVGGLSAANYPAMLAGPRNEIFALFNDMGAGRLRGLVHAGQNLRAREQAIRAAPSLFPEYDTAEIIAVRSAAARRETALASLSAAAKAKISAALGSKSWIDELRDLSPEEGREQLTLRFGQALLRAGAQYVLYMPIHDERGIHKYYLVHASKSLHGFRAMKEAVSGGLNGLDDADRMMEAIRAQLRLPFARVVAHLRQRFGTSSVKWTESKQGHEPSVKGALLNDTAVFDFQLQELKAEFEARHWLSRRDRLLYFALSAESEESPRSS